MKRSIIELLVGDLEEKRAYRRFTKRVRALPKDYRRAFRKMQYYLYHFPAADFMQVMEDLLALLEESAAAGRSVLQVVGADAAAFCDELLCAAGTDPDAAGEKLNAEIAAHFRGKEV